MNKILHVLQKKIFCYIAAGIFCVIFLGYCIGWMDQFQSSMEYREFQYNTGSYIAYFSGGLEEEDIVEIAENPDVTQCGIVTYYKKIAEGKGKDTWIRGANENYMLRNSLVLEGELPQKRNEFTAEKWVLGSLGVEAEIGEKVTFYLEDEEGNGSTETFILSGILTDSSFTKENGTVNIFIPCDLKADRHPIVNLDIDEKRDLAQCLEEIKRGLSNENCFYKYSTEAGRMRRNRNIVTKDTLKKSLTVTAILFIYLLGIWKTEEESFLQNTARLRICGIGTRDLLAGFRKKVFLVYICAAAGGGIAGRVMIYGMTRLSHLDTVSFLFWGEQVKIAPETLGPFWLLLLLLSFLAAAIWVFYIGTQIKRSTVMDQIKGENVKKIHAYRMKTGKKGESKLYFRTEWMSVLLFCLAGIIFLTVNYQQRTRQKIARNEAFAYCQNGDFQVTGYRHEDPLNGVNEKQLEELRALQGTEQIEAAMVLPVRVVMDSAISYAQEYYETYNTYAKDMYYKEFFGEEKSSGDLVYKSALMGYNEAALTGLTPYVTEGKIDIASMKNSNLAVVFVPQYEEGKYRQRFYKNARKVMDYKVGDRISVKVRDNYTEDMEKYWSMEDAVSSHTEVFEVGAIVYYPYLPNTSVMGLVSPDIIISDERMRELTGQQIYRVVNIVTEPNTDAAWYANSIADIFSADGGITISDFILARNEKETRNSIYAAMETLWSLLLGSGFIFCAVGMLKHHIMKRKKNLLLGRIVGLSKQDIRTDAKKEGVIYFCRIFFLTLTGAFVLQYGIYRQSGLFALGLSFWGRESYKVFLMAAYLFILLYLFLKSTDTLLQGEIMEEYE